MSKFSVIICTYNPNLSLFIRLLNAVTKLNYDKTLFEIIIVDNNSSPALADIYEIAAFLKLQENAQIITEIKPGLTHARIAGIDKANNEWLVFFDDDNEPAADYLTQMNSIISAQPETGAWGPGIVTVEYPDTSYGKRFDPFRYIFQERRETTKRISNEMWWQDCYPAGTGLVIRKDLAGSYTKNVLNGTYNLSDRKGKSLSSGGDMQMVLHVVKEGFSAGVHPALKINHMIDKNRLRGKYLRRLAYGTAYSNIPGHVQVLGKEKAGLFLPPQNVEILKQLYYHIKVKLRQQGSLQTAISFSNQLGTWGALYDLNPGIKPLFIWKILCRFLQVK